MSDNKEGITASAMAILAGAGKRVAEILAPAPKWLTTAIERVEAGKKERGRPIGSHQYDDTQYLIEIGRLLETGKAGSFHRAAKIVLQGKQVPGQSDTATIKRWSRAFKKDDVLYRSLGRDADPTNLK